LDVRNRDTVTGDLLEEYREVILPSRGAGGAWLWYARQVASFVTVAGLIRALTYCFKEGPVFDRIAQTSWFWLMTGAAAFVALFGGLVMNQFRPSTPIGALVAFSSLLGITALFSSRSRTDVGRLWRLTLVCASLLSAVLVIRLLFDVLDPVDPVDRFLAQARDDYSEFDYPRRWVPAMAVAAVFIGAGLVAAMRTGRVGTGIVTAMAASGAAGCSVYIVVVAVSRTFDALPTMFVPIFVMFSTLPGMIGALFGRALASAKQVRTHG
jgi:hypothetical protein